MLMLNRVDFCRRLVTVDETWIHYYTPEKRMNARQRTEAGTKRPREAQWVENIMASLFWDFHGILELIEGRNRCQTTSHGAKKKIVSQDQPWLKLTI